MIKYLVCNLINWYHRKTINALLKRSFSPRFFEFFSRAASQFEGCSELYLGSNSIPLLFSEFCRVSGLVSHLRKIPWGLDSLQSVEIPKTYNCYELKRRWSGRPTWNTFSSHCRSSPVFWRSECNVSLFKVGKKLHF